MRSLSRKTETRPPPPPPPPHPASKSTTLRYLSNYLSAILIHVCRNCFNVRFFYASAFTTFFFPEKRKAEAGCGSSNCSRSLTFNAQQRKGSKRRQLLKDETKIGCKMFGERNVYIFLPHPTPKPPLPCVSQYTNIEQGLRDKPTGTCVS